MRKLLFLVVLAGCHVTVEDSSGIQDFYWTMPFDLDYIRRSGFLAQPTVFWRRRVIEDVHGYSSILQRFHSMIELTLCP